MHFRTIQIPVVAFVLFLAAFALLLLERPVLSFDDPDMAKLGKKIDQVLANQEQALEWQKHVDTELAAIKVRATQR
ncbi:MAG: hypothetical protein JW937_06340 [Candidatus Omnitrophica bacterium]|nr:hypothetical protein [Candidatus Omnitrophota bacterium]